MPEMPEILESFEHAKEELKRADHLIFVSLKYTRTVDVLKSIIERLINAINLSFNTLLLHSKKQKKIKEIPTAPIAIAEAIKVYYAMKPYTDYVEFYYLLRRLSKAQFGRASEYRRNVTMTAQFEDHSIEITIDIINDYFERTKELVKHIEEAVGLKQEK